MLGIEWKNVMDSMALSLKINIRLMRESKSVTVLFDPPYIPVVMGRGNPGVSSG